MLNCTHPPVKQAERGRGATGIATHPRLNVCDAVEDLIYDLCPGRELHTGVSVVLRVNNVLPEHRLHVICGCVPILLHFCFG